MGWVSPLGYQMWNCGCGRHSLALALAACPSCGKPRPGAEGKTAPAAPRKRKVKEI